MAKKLPAPPPETRCVCGHAYYEHVQGGDRHACQHGAEPPFTRLCPCGKFRGKEERRAIAKSNYVERAAERPAAESPPKGSAGDKPAQ